MSIPLPIETERLLIRRFTDEDLLPLADLYADPVVMRYIPYGVLDTAGLESVLAKYARVEEADGFTFWAVRDRESGRFIGDVGFGVYEPTGEPELGYSLAHDAWGQGYASEAAPACLDAAFAHLPAERIVAHGRPHVLFAKERP